ncbi:ribbon-helix-helix CopG family protein [Mycoplasmopsis mustelae]|uniref:Ribbon-helix-helix CopG family protein n=1 Tax=Mycoplasmopsis mustelae TaxID=171289 RepID=A0A4R7UDV3_9BACT|nr:ribbon-helix-helix domain-containing protein [Mycoplasmopsis mustelae]TDV23522.1 ribbon-helix-helix CopG family protein [Mycoplasmopsis mustelae]
MNIPRKIRIRNRVRIEFPIPLVEKLQKLAQDTNESTSAIIRRAIHEFLKNHGAE